MKKSILFALAIFLAGTVSLNAQDKKAAVIEKQNVERINQQVEKLTTSLDLDATQVKKVTAIYEESEAKLTDLKERLVSLRERKMNLDSEDQEAVDAFNKDYSDATAERKTIMEERKASVASVLNEEQKAKFAPVKVEKK